MAEEPTQEIVVKNQGPIYSLTLHVPRRGGIMVLYGPNGSGKSSALDGINQLIAKQGKLVPRDGSPGVEITGFEGKVTLGRRIGRSGELEVRSLEGFSIADLVEPRVKDDLEARDMHRTKALLRLADAPADVSLFYPVVGSQEEFDFYVPAEALATDDLVAMQGSIKRALEKAARDAGEIATRELASAEAKRLAAAETDITLPDDSELLSAAFEDATRTEARLKAEKQAREDAEKRTAQAKEALEKLRSSYKGPTFKEANDKEGEAFGALQLANDEVKRLEFLLEEAKKVQTAAVHAHAIAEKVEETAKNHETSVKAFEETVNAELPPVVTEDQLTRAAEDLKTAKENVEIGALVRKAKENLAAASQLKKSGLEAQSKSESLRLAAQSTEMVLSAGVESLGVPLKFLNNRLIASGTDRPNEVFEDLSDGEKWKLVADLVVKKVGPGGAVVLPQRAWQDLDQANRRILAEGVQSKDPNGVGVIIITAQADSNYPEIVSRLYDPYALVE